LLAAFVVRDWQYLLGDPSLRLKSGSGQDDAVRFVLVDWTGESPVTTRTAKD
jgi:hypothetical protein